ncbi:hypothetical protein CUJ83_09070 [Methanocella sp. CWC-04]|uniref:Uncharacterized protein n=1 Tax=Methanooceanicella nereidis TaxID=2052831 RepID=A0AAP2RD62_9EURY|nr:hypothetical protein [Methanocella sp. CWC-04]MCD1295148.1 hypothetical protein [Methanocella sp. CWC-04]
MTDAEGEPSQPGIVERIANIISDILFYIISALFTLLALFLIFLAFYRLYYTIISLPEIMLDALFESIGFTTVAAAVFELAKTIYEEDIQSKVKMIAPRKIRRFISRFMTVIIISLSIEFLAMVFRYAHKPDEFAYLTNSAAVAIGIAAIFIAWSYYNKTSLPAEVMEHEIFEKGSSEK